MNKFIKNEKGFSFFMVFLTLILISVLGLSLITVSANSVKISTSEREDQSVYYIAEAGLVTKISEIENELLVVYNSTKAYYDSLSSEKQIAYNFEHEFLNNVESQLSLSPITLGGFEAQFGHSPSAKIDILKMGSANSLLQYKITSIGTIGNKSRTVSQTLTIKLDVNTSKKSIGGAGGKYAVQTMGDISLVGGAKIIGSVATQSGSISLDGGATITGEIFAAEDKIIFPDWMNGIREKSKGPDAFPISILPPFPDDRFATLESLPYPGNLEIKSGENNKTLLINNGNFLADNYISKNYQLNMDNDLHFKEFKINEDKTITINTGSNDRNLFVEKLNIEQGHIKIIGTGKLNIYVKNSFHAKGSINQNGDTNQVNMFYAGASKLTLADETQIAGSLYAKSASLEFTGGVGVKGNIYTGGTSLTFSGGSNSQSQHFFAPNANVKLLGGAQLTGAVIGNSFSAVGGTSVTFSQGSNGNSSPGTEVTEYGEAINLTLQSSIVEED